MTPNEEILQIIRYAPGPIGASAIYEQCKSIENISDVSSRLSQLFNQGKLDRIEITTANNRKGFAYSIKKPGEAESAAPAAEPSAPAAPAAAKPAAAKTRGKEKAKPDPVANGLDQVESVLKDSAAPDQVTVKEALAGKQPGADAARLADAIIADIHKQLAPGLEGGPLWWINQDGELEIADRCDPVMAIGFTREQALLMAEMVIGTNNLLGHL